MAVAAVGSPLLYRGHGGGGEAGAVRGAPPTRSRHGLGKRQALLDSPSPQGGGRGWNRGPQGVGAIGSFDGPTPPPHADGDAALVLEVSTLPARARRGRGGGTEEKQ